MHSNKALHRIAIPLRSIAADDLGRQVAKADYAKR